MLGIWRLTQISVTRARRVAHELLEWLCEAPEHTLVHEFLSGCGVLPPRINDLCERDAGFKALYEHAWQIQEAKLCRQLIQKSGNTSGILFLLRHWHGWDEASNEKSKVSEPRVRHRPHQGLSDGELENMLQGYLG